jgi:hypothetical protein
MGGTGYNDTAAEPPRYGIDENMISIGTNGVITFGTAHHPNGGSEPVPSPKSGAQMHDDGTSMVDGLSLRPTADSFGVPSV